MTETGVAGGAQREPSGPVRPGGETPPIWLEPALLLIDSARYLLSLTRLLYQSLVSVFWERRKSKRLLVATFLNQVYFTAVQALPLTIMIAVAVGALLMSQASILLPKYGFPDYAEWLTVLLVFKEIAPVVVALVVIARSANAVVIEIGVMKVNGEMRALDVLGFNLDYYIVLPRVLAMVASVVALTIIFCAAGLWGGFWVADTLGLLDSGFLLANLEKQFTPELLTNILTRASCFGLIISLVACFHGLRVKMSPTEVPQQASIGVVRALTLCFIVNFLLSVYG